MTVFESIFLGLVQGITEFIPVSSSGHLVLAEHLFSNTPDHLFIEALDIGTALALIIFFWPRLRQLYRQVTVQRDYRLARNIIITCLPAGFLGLAFSSFIETNPIFASPLLVAVMLGVVGFVMIIVDRLPHLANRKDGQALSSKRALTIGIAQAFALIPGVSRAGSTIIAGRFMGLSSVTAAEYSFMVSIPIMLGLIAKLLLKSSDRAYIITHLEPVIIGNITAFISGFLAIRFMLRYLAKHGLAIFGWYRVVVSVMVLTFLLLQ